MSPATATTPLVFADPDEGTAEIDLPWATAHFDVRRRHLTVGVNGVVALVPDAELPGENPDLGSTAGFPLAAPWWDDWVLGDDGSVATRLFGPSGDRTFVIRWVVRPAGAPEAPDEYVDIQVKFRELEDLIEFVYVDTTTSVGADGSSGSIAIRGRPTGGGFAYSFDEASLDPAGFAIRWTPVRCDGRRATRLGTFGNDVIQGTPGDDVIVALSGNDRVIGRGGHDWICGSRGADRLEGGSGRERLFGEQGPDDLRGGPGHDWLFGGDSPDHLVGGPGIDRCPDLKGVDTGSSCARRPTF